MFTDKILNYLKDLRSVVLAYSGGVDSTLLLYLLKKSDIERVLAVTADSESYSSDSLKVAKRHARNLGIDHLVIKTDELKNCNFTDNSALRCYYCKYELFSELKDIASHRRISNLLDGSNADDTNDYRPGMKAADELGVLSPFKIFGWNKKKIKEVSKIFSISDSHRPQTVCFASRVPYGTEITADNLAMIEKSEAYLEKQGFNGVRVRSDGITARIEVPEEDIEKVIKKNVRKKITAEFLNIGFKFVSLDIEGFISGKMNRLIKISNE